MTGPAACSRPHDHRHADGIIPSHQPALGVQEKHHACLGEGSDEDSAEPEWFECGCPDSDSLGEPEGHAAVIKVVADEEPVLTEQLYVELELEEPVASAAAVATGGEPIKPVQHAVGDALSADGAKKPHRRGDAPSETGFDALPTARRERELDVSLPTGDTPTKLASAPKPLAPIGPRAWAATPTGRPELSETYTFMFDQDDARLLTKHEQERARSISASAEEEAAADEEPVLAATLEEPDMLRAWLGYFREINTEADLELEEPEQRALGEPDGLDGNAYATAAEPGVGQDESLLHASANKPEQCAHGEPNGLEGNTSVTAGTEAGIASGFSDAPPETSIEALPTTRCEIGALLPASSMLPGGGYKISSDKIPFGNTLEPDRLSFAATLVATNALLPEGETPASLVAIAAAVAATHVLLPEGKTPTSLVAIAAAVATGGELVEPEQHAAADEPEQSALGEFNRLDGNAHATAAEPSGRADESLQGSANEPEQGAHGDPDGLMVTLTPRPPRRASGRTSRRHTPPPTSRSSARTRSPMGSRATTLPRPARRPVSLPAAHDEARARHAPSSGRHAR